MALQSVSVTHVCVYNDKLPSVFTPSKKKTEKICTLANVRSGPQFCPSIVH